MVTRVPEHRVSPYQELLQRDSKAVPAILRAESRRDFGTDSLDASRYTSQEFFDKEARALWPRVWQMVCREEELPNTGDVIVYDIVGYSLLVVRAADGTLRAFHNSCLHRGRKLLTGSGCLDKLRCEFHGWTWNLDGSIRNVPCWEDFSHLSDRDLELPQAQVATWGGFVFINMDRSAPSLMEFLGVLPEHFDRWQLQDCWKAVHVAKRIACNWKIAQEAFMESYHVIATHPQILTFFADTDAQYDCYGDHVNRNLAAFGAPSQHLAANPPSAEQVTAGMLAMLTPEMKIGELPAAKVRENPRATLADLFRAKMSRVFGPQVATACDAEILDALVYNVFPNFAPWGGFAPNIVYRWRPDGTNPAATIMEVMILKRCGLSQRRPAPVPIHWLRDDEPWATAQELPVLGAVIDQDMHNMPLVQQGLNASATGRVQLSRYQESRIRHFHRTLDQYLAAVD